MHTWLRARDRVGRQQAKGGLALEKHQHQCMRSWQHVNETKQVAQVNITVFSLIHAFAYMYA